MEIIIEGALCNFFTDLQTLIQLLIQGIAIAKAKVTFTCTLNPFVYICNVFNSTKKRRGHYLSRLYNPKKVFQRLISGQNFLSLIVKDD